MKPYGDGLRSMTGMVRSGGSGRSKYSLAPLPDDFAHPYQNLNTIDHTRTDRGPLERRADPSSISAQKYKAYLGGSSSRTKLPALQSNSSMGHIRRVSRDFKKENMEALKRQSASLSKERASYVSSQQIRSLAKQAPDIQASKESFASIKRVEKRRLTTLETPSLSETPYLSQRKGSQVTFELPAKSSKALVPVNVIPSEPSAKKGRQQPSQVDVIGSGQAGSRGHAVVKFKSEQQKILEKLLQPRQRARDYEGELEAIKSVDMIQIDYSEALSIKRGDMAVIPGEVFRCSPARMDMQNVQLVLKRVDCIDRRLFDQLIYECDTFMRFRGHPNVLSLFSYWTEPPSTPYKYKTLVCLYEEAPLGDMMRSVVLSSTRPSAKMVLKYCADICKGLSSLHNCGIIHGNIRPANFFLSQDNVAMLGDIGKVKLDEARDTHSHLSKVLVSDAISRTLVYWAPELLNGERATYKADMWAFGVSIFQIISGEQPFNTLDEAQFREEVLRASVDMGRLHTTDRLRIIIENTLQVDPNERWDASFLLTIIQEDFAIEIQRVWRGHQQRKRFRQIANGLVKIQSLARGFVQKKRYLVNKTALRNQAILTIQSTFRMFLQKKKFLKQKRAIMKMQANVLTRQQKRAFLKLKQDTTMAQAYIKRFMAMLWYKRIKVQNKGLDDALRNITDQIGEYNLAANNFKKQFVKGEFEEEPKQLDHMTDFEGMQMKAFERKDPQLRTIIPSLLQAQEELQELKKRNEMEQRRRGSRVAKQINSPPVGRPLEQAMQEAERARDLLRR